LSLSAANFETHPTAMDPYKYSGPIDTTISPDLSTLKDKSVVVTGGELGILHLSEPETDMAQAQMA
jgi:hypothetical protein